ncbi:rhomboid family intramembrane serine protease [Vulcanisaeta sp. JCM 14467]|uniref:rhomboid family intramembrane serine protease n=1 Tax=Vulcanisaeta sp. JCM 14467 TaxID=1295370 RepID=UPI0006D01B50|nr:rhomboid family intramembrane serine protease [Vulcanisaeta sp. JCM 14467]
MYRFRNTLIAFLVSTAFTVPIFIAMGMGQSAYDLVVALLGSTWPPITPWGFVTAIFAHPTFEDYLFDMLTLWMIGPYFETVFGRRNFWLTFMLSGVVSSLSPILYYAMGTPVLVGGSSGALFGLVGFIIATPYRGVILSNPINILAIIFLLSPLAFAFGIAYLGHLLGFIVGIILGYLYVKRSRDIHSAVLI